MSSSPNPSPFISSSTSMSATYNSRASTYDNATFFHRNLAEKYVQYVNPQPGESLLNLAYSTGLVTLLFAPILQSTSSPKPEVVGVDISPGMLDVARSKLKSEIDSGREVEIGFVEHDITRLDEVVELQELEEGFDIITICSALVLLSHPAAALKHWGRYLKPGGRLVVDVPHSHSMLGVKLSSLIAPEFGLSTMGDRSWISDPDSLRSIMEMTGLKTRVLETEE